MDHTLFVSELKKSAHSGDPYPAAWIGTDTLIRLASGHGLSPLKAQRIAIENRILPERYLRNYPSIGFEEHLRLTDARVLIVGLGGLGGTILEILGRTGAGFFILADGDCFEESNLNRQLLSTSATIGQPKAHAARQRLAAVNPFCEAEVVADFLGKKDLPGLFERVDLVVDALGGIEFRPVLMAETANAGLPLVTGFIAGTTGLAGTVYPGGKNPSAFWQGEHGQGAECVLGNVATIVSLIATIQAGEVIRILTGKKSGLAEKVFLADLDSMTFDLFEL